MRWLFIHQDFPGQYVHIIRHLLARRDEVVGIGQSSSLRDDALRFVRYAGARASQAHPYAQEFEHAVSNGLAVAAECEKLKRGGFTPDVVVGHNGWGEILFVKEIWPSAPLLGYFEFFYHATGTDADFDPEFPPLPDLAWRLRTRNAVNLLGLEAVDRGQTPTVWQRDQYPPAYRDKIAVIHEGIDADHVRPDPSARIWLKDRSFGTGDPVITYSARRLEPYRGFHVFMRTLPRLLRDLPDAHVMIVGDDGAMYGTLPSAAPNWREAMLAELSGEMDCSRIHFLGPLGFQQYLAVLQISAVHLYLTYPFVLSWSLLEAQSAGCLVVGSRTPPVEEVLVDGHNGYLTDFFDVEGTARLVTDLVRAGRHDSVRQAARNTILDRYDLKRSIPAYLSLVQDMIGRHGASA